MKAIAQTYYKVCALSSQFPFFSQGIEIVDNDSMPYAVAKASYKIGDLSELIEVS